MDEKLLILLGLGAIGYLAATNFSEDDETNEIQNIRTFDNQPQQPIYQQPIYQQPPINYNESYFPTSGVSNPSPSISYTNYPSEKAFENTNVSPLGYGQMVQENFSSDYIPLGKYKENPDQIPVYDETTGTVGLPVADMTDLSAGENNKYIYDRTIGSIGFTSTKIGGRRRGQADYVRGDLAIMPDSSPWFQVSSDPANSLLQGSMNVSNGIGSAAPTTAPVQSTSSMTPGKISGGKTPQKVKQTQVAAGGHTHARAMFVEEDQIKLPSYCWNNKSSVNAKVWDGLSNQQALSYLDNNPTCDVDPTYRQYLKANINAPVQHGTLTVADIQAFFQNQSIQKGMNQI